MSVKKLTEEEEKKIKEDVANLVLQFSKESNRAAVILCAARIDYLLNESLRANLLPNPTGSDELLDSDRAIGTFSARTNLAYRLGLIGADLARAIHLFRKIRNEFAHSSSEVSISEGSQRDRILELAKPLQDDDAFNSFTEISSSMKNASEDRSRLLSVAITIITQLELLKVFVRVLKPEVTVSCVGKEPE